MRAPASPAARPGSSLVSIRGALLALAASILLCWPMLIVSAPLVFPDSAHYVKQGGEFVRALYGLLVPGAVEDPAIALAEIRSTTIRSAPYSVFLLLTSLSPIGLIGSVIAQTAMVLFLLGALVERETEAPRAAVAVVALACGTLTALPWFASYLMPDILAAGVILYAAVLVRGFDAFGPAQRLALGALAAFAIISHHGHFPLAVACIGAALALRLVQSRLTLGVTVAGLAPVLVAVAANAALGMLVFDGPSATPRRLPILLARSIEDGPARWHLEENCATEGYAICEVFADGMPVNVFDVMWAEQGLHHVATEDHLTRIRREEPIILWRAFREYPARQVWSVVGNTAEQLTAVGAADFQYASIERPGWTPRVTFDFDRGRPLFEAVGVAQAASVLAAILALVLMARSDGLRAGSRERELLVVVAVGLLANAAIFGGLSAPADRYQARIAWILPALAALFWLERRRRAARERQPAGA